METNQSIRVGDRIRFLDALRGISVLFIFIANIGFFAGTFFIFDGQYKWAVFPTDLPLDFLCFSLIDGKFYTVFSLLFGIGCAIQFQNTQNFRSFFSRRMFWLLIIGATHLCLIWLGDILTLYALLGFVLMWFVNVPNKKLLVYAIILILLPIVNDIALIVWNYPRWIENFAATVAQNLGVKPILRDGFGDFIKNDDWSVFFKTNLSNTFLRISRMLDEGRPFKVLGIFLIGLWTGRKIIFENLLENTSLLRKIAIWGICIGLPLNFFRTYIEFFIFDDFWGFIKTITYALGTVPLGLGYAAALALWYCKKSNFLKIFEPVGKMALTNYLSQTLISIAIFYGIGFGLGGKLGFTLVLGIALLVFALQIIISALWLRKFRQGPVEWFWRWATRRAL